MTKIDHVSKLGKLQKEGCHLTFVNEPIAIGVNFIKHFLQIRLFHYNTASEWVTDENFGFFKTESTIVVFIIVIPNLFNTLLNQISCEYIFCLSWGIFLFFFNHLIDNLVLLHKWANSPDKLLNTIKNLVRFCIAFHVGWRWNYVIRPVCGYSINSLFLTMSTKGGCSIDGTCIWPLVPFTSQSEFHTIFSKNFCSNNWTDTC